MGDENSRLKDELRRREERKESQDELVCTANANQEDLVRECKVERVRNEGNRNMEALLLDCAMYQDRLAEAEAELEEMREKEKITAIPSNIYTVRPRFTRMVWGKSFARCIGVNYRYLSSRVEAVALADRDAIIYKLREHVTRLEGDNTNLTDQHRLESNLKNTKGKLERTVSEKEETLQRLTESKDAELQMGVQYKQMKGNMLQLRSELSSVEERHASETRDVELREEEKREEIKRGCGKTIDDLRRGLLLKQNEISELKLF
eukprot:sb/3468384/